MNMYKGERKERCISGKKGTWKGRTVAELEQFSRERRDSGKNGLICARVIGIRVVRSFFKMRTLLVTD